MKRLFSIVLACLLANAAGAGPARAQDFFSSLFGWGQRPAPAPVEHVAPKPKLKKKVAKPPLPSTQTAAPAEPASEGPPPPYEPQLLRLSEILGALSFLRDLCDARDGEDWRAKMAALLDAEAKTGRRRLELTGAFNRGFRGYETSYRACTPNARAAIARYIDEGERIAHDIAYRYGSS